MKTMINNFCEGNPLEVEARTHSELGHLVTISQSVGSLSLFHSLRPEQARLMAAALIVAANSFDKPVDAV
jgi:hypothetical protein